MEVWEDAQEFARRLKAAKAYFGETQKEFGDRIGRSARTVRSIEKGELASLGRTAGERRRLAQRVVDSGAPAELFGLEKPPALVRELVAQHEAALAMLVEHLDLQDEADLARASVDVDRLFGSSIPTSGESGLGAESG